MTNINSNVLKNFNKNEPKSIIQNTQSMEKINHKIILEVINELKEKQPFSLSSDIHLNVNHTKTSINQNLLDTKHCSRGTKGGFCKCCGDFTEYSLRRRRFY